MAHVPVQQLYKKTLNQIQTRLIKEDKVVYYQRKKTVSAWLLRGMKPGFDLEFILRSQVKDFPFACH
ncbi:unnamed protein product [Sphenostylis stenocarpa]|uniref:Uncharacterized protein n=1 Tax=Sphenostylis stenocarpa TaxID=92480 RepID=A0AA86VTV7_9FABA|nr:unnamed protein product [Sphenostylis stenocarpa]